MSRTAVLEENHDAVQQTKRLLLAARVEAVQAARAREDTAHALR